MSEGPPFALLWAGALIFLLGTAVLVRVLGWRLAMTVVLVKVGLSVVYFGWVDTGALRLLDDVTYSEDATELLALGGGAMGFVGNPAQTDLLFSIAGGRHVGYYVLNAIGKLAFGDYYWSAVLLNVFLSCLAGRAVARLVRDFGFSASYTRASTVFFLLHWDVLAWSSFLNLKDTAVMTLLVWSFVWILRFAKTPRLFAALGALVPLWLLLFFRWYVPVLAAGAVALWGVAQLRGWPRVLIILAVAGLLLWQFPITLPAVEIRPGGALEGAVRYLTTPRPWGLAPEYRFLLLPSALHWLFLPFAAVGMWGLWSRSSAARCLVLLLLVATAFYAVVPILQGPRHRYQLVFVLALLQFHGLHSLVTGALARPRFSSAVPRGPGNRLDSTGKA